MRDSYSKRAVRWVAGAALAATVLGVTGCSSDDDSGESGEKEPTANGSSTPQDSNGSSGSNGGGTGDGSAPPRANGVPHSTAREAVASWVRTIVKGKPKRTCQVMAQPASGSSPAQVGTPKRCNSNEPDIRKMRQSAGKFREAFSPKPPPNDPKVRVAQVPVSGGKAVVPADRITIDGKALDKVILSNSTGVKEGQLDVKVKASEIKGAWYVTDLDLNIG